MRLRHVAPLLVLFPLSGCGPGADGRGGTAAPDRGAQVYAIHCASCHQRDGRGLSGAQPALAGSATVTGDPSELIAWVMFGERPASLQPHRSVVVMPQFAWLSDADLAAVLTYTRSEFGNQASPVEASQVAAVRAGRTR